MNQMAWKLQLSHLAGYLLFLLICFTLVPKEPPLFGMALIPGPLALLSGFGLPLIGALALGFVVFKKSGERRGLNTAFFFLSALSIWLLAFLLFY